MRRFKARMPKSKEKHSGTKVHLIGPGTVLVANHILRDTEVGARDPAGGNDTIQLGRSYEAECNVGDVCRYINVMLQCGPTVNANTSAGWIEYAFVTKREADADPVNTNLGTQTLQNVCTTYFRNECFHTGAVPIGQAQCATANILLKIPKAKQVLRAGEQIVLYLYARTPNSVETATQTFKVYSTFIYSNHH